MSKELRSPKKVIFFDGDGTLWYPRTTLWNKVPHWVYKDETIVDPIAEMTATPHAQTTLEHLGQQGVWRVLLSASPLTEAEGLQHRRAIAGHVGILDLLDEVHVTFPLKENKGLRIAEWLKTHAISPDAAYMVGDSYEWDILSARTAGVPGLLIRSEYEAPVIQQHALTNIIIDDVSGIFVPKA